ncbi:hypothetical protein MMC22_001126 [Lobaria immixta]|nr:hypothetical protein [Lobaria immixta]
MQNHQHDHNVYRDEIDAADRNAVLGLDPNNPHQKAVSPPTEKQSCGATVTEALERNCTFDPLTVQWLPQACLRAGADEFSEQEHWRYWTDQDGKHEIADLSRHAGPGDEHWYWTTGREHLTHCVYMLLRVAKVGQGGGRMDGMSGNYNHSVHCAMNLLEAARSWDLFNVIQTQGQVRFGSC